MLIHRLAQELSSAPEYKILEELLDQKEDASLDIAKSARPFIVASVFARNPRPILLIVAGEDAANRVARTLVGYLGLDFVHRYPAIDTLPWSEKPVDGTQVGKRTRAVNLLHTGEPGIVVATARSLLRLLPPPETHYFEPFSCTLGEEIPFESISEKLIFMGYIHSHEADKPGTFAVKGDSVDIFAAQEQTPVRIEFFGDEVDRIRKMVASTGQTISDLEKVTIYPSREIALTQSAVKRAERVLYQASQMDQKVARDVEMLKEGILFDDTERYVPSLYDETVGLLAHSSEDTLVVLSEPRALFDDATRGYEELASKAHEAQVEIEGLYVEPKDLDFGGQQRLTLSSIMRAGKKSDATLQASRPEVEGGEGRLFSQLRSLCASRFSTILAIPDRQARSALEMRLSDERIPFEESLRSYPENSLSLLDQSVEKLRNSDATKTLSPGVVTITDYPIISGIIISSAKLGIVSIDDTSSRKAVRSKERSVDPTEFTFPFEPGDYVVHKTHGVAYFSQIVRQSIGDTERDYFLLEYAHEDKLYVPFEQVDKLSRYVGPDGSNPRLTRLNTSDWSRATTKARKSAKKMAFDLVDLYTRRNSVKGHKFPEDTAWQLEMEDDFPYEETPDQLSAIADIKADMESDKPMDRLLCGDVGFGKTEVALRAAFKAVQDNKQVMFLAPTTILAQQHYATFYERFAPYGVNVEVLSRFRTPAQQREALEGFQKGTVDVLIGTHRLLSNDVNPKDLGFIIIDEEHRFGVQAKEQLKNLREQVDVLALTATPIPRTLQMSLSGVRDMTLITTPPPHRIPVKVHVGEWDEDIVSAAIRNEVSRGGQVYYVSNRVKSIDDAKERVYAAAPEVRVGVAHGQLSKAELEGVMEDFAAHKYDVLIATTIIESGIDNPHTNTLIIEDSQRLGLAQLYQLKGRVGRSHNQAYAFFMFPPHANLTEQATERLNVINEHQELGSGMKVAMRDLEIRGAGNLVGAEQHGNLSAVGFDLFTSMLGEAVAQAHGENEPAEELEDVNINVSVDYYLSEDYVPDTDKRVLAYRKLALANTLGQINDLEDDIVASYGELPEAAQNLFDRARVRIRAQRLKISSIALTGGKLQFTGIEIPKSIRDEVKKEHGIYRIKSKKLSIPFKASEDGNPLKKALDMLVLIGGSDEDID